MWPWEYTKVNKALEIARARWGQADIVTTYETVDLDGVEVHVPIIKSYKCPACTALFTFSVRAAEHFVRVHTIPKDIA